MPTTKVPIYTCQLPPTPCTPEMREDVVSMAKKRGESIAEIQRQAFALFLAENYIKAKEMGINATVEHGNGVGR